MGAASPHRCRPRREPAGLLVRPDGVVAWAGNDGAQGLETALRAGRASPLEASSGVVSGPVKAKSGKGQ